MTNAANCIHVHVKSTVYFLNDPSAFFEDPHILYSKGFRTNERRHFSKHTVQPAWPQNAYL